MDVRWQEVMADTLVGVPRLRGVLSRSAVVMILLSGDETDPEIVFEERAAGIPQGGEIGFPGGKVDPLTDKSPEDTALREASEELGVPRNRFHILGRMDSVLTRWGLMIDVVVCRTTLHLSDFRPNPEEVSRVFGLRLSWLLAQTPGKYQIMVQSHPVHHDASTGEQTVLFPPRHWNCRNGIISPGGTP